MNENRWLNEREQSAWRGLLTLQADLFQYLERQLRKQSGMSGSDYSVLARLSEAPDERLRAFELAKILRWEKSRLSQHLTRMVSRGLVTRGQCPTDQRGAYVILTEQGRRAVEAAAGPHVADVRRVFIDHLTPEQLDLLTELGRQVEDRLAELGQEP
ncbi:MarR family winged helix-turn-helix transcriptional regulator [Kitasatospora sp. NPDC052896]|uniref:MarR family winged helix-turn-helix transcriptional regulator n=1 Tax=Kitasatospora sp. NPDC052896 TaxID=3364061 RepID=UPI0037CB55A9